MNVDKSELIECIMQLRISNFIKQNRNLDKKEIVKKVEEILEDKERMYNMDEIQLEKELKNETKNGEL